MTTQGLVFILHGPRAAPVADEVAAALAPRTIIKRPMAEEDQRTVVFGAGAVCVVIWTPRMRLQDGVARVLQTLPAAQAKAVIYQRSGAPLPQEFYDASFHIVEGSENVADDAERLREAVAQAEAQPGPAHPRGNRSTPRLATKTAHPPVSQARRRMAARSAMGLALTFAVVGVVGPWISNQADADHRGPRNARADRDAPPPTGEAAETQAVLEPTPVEDPLTLLVREAPSEAPVVRASLQPDPRESTPVAEARPDAADASALPPHAVASPTANAPAPSASAAPATLPADIVNDIDDAAKTGETPAPDHEASAAAEHEYASFSALSFHKERLKTTL